MDWWFIIAIYWGVSYLAFLGWYVKEMKAGKRGPLPWALALNTAIIILIWPLVAVYLLLRKLTK